MFICVGCVHAIANSGPIIDAIAARAAGTAAEGGGAGAPSPWAGRLWGRSPCASVPQMAWRGRCGQGKRRQPADLLAA